MSIGSNKYWVYESRPPAAKKSPAIGNTVPSNQTGKAGNKKAGSSKDPKQGNILSFFKRV
jgi:DNA polymerase delta subunit 3